MRRGFEIEEHYTFVPKKEPEKKSELGLMISATFFWGVILLVSFVMDAASLWMGICGILFLLCFAGVFIEALGEHDG